MVLGRKTVHVVEDEFLEFCALKDVSALGLGSLELFDSLLVWVDDSDAAVLEGVSVHEALFNEGREDKDVFKLLGSDIFTLRQLEDVLRSVDDLDSAVGEDLSNVAGFEPSLLIEGLLSLVITQEVASEH